MKADIELAHSKPDVKCWTNEACSTLRSLLGGQELADCMKGRKKIELEIFPQVLLAYPTRMMFGGKLVHSRDLGVMM